MSKPSALPSPQRRAIRPAPTAPAAGPERTLQAPAFAASAALATPPEDRITSGRGSPARLSRLAESVQVAPEQRREVGVDHRGRAALVLAEARQHLVRGRNVDAGQLAAQPGGDALLVRGIEVGEEQADRDRLGSAGAQQLRQSTRLVLAQWLDRPGGADPLGRLRTAIPPRPAASAWGSRVGRGRGGFGGRSRAGRQSLGSRPAPSARRALRAGRWCPPSSRGRRSRPWRPRRRPVAAPPRSPSSPPPFPLLGWSASLPCGLAARRRGRRR